MTQYQKTSKIGCSAKDLYDWHGRGGAFERLVPPWQSMRVLSRSGRIETGAEIKIRLRKFGFSSDWLARITNSCDGALFEDTQVKGPFAHWNHRHEFLEIDPDHCQLVDSIDYSLPGGRFGSFVGDAFARSELERVFRYRHEITKNDLSKWRRFRDYPRKNILISGGYGFLGRRLGDFLRAQGHRVSVLSRNPKQGDARWNPKEGKIDSRDLEDFDAVFHLAGENLAAGRWNDRRKRLIRKSRIESTKLLINALGETRNPPNVFIGASGIGYYGDSGDKVVTEASGPGGGFLAELCSEWEDAASLATRFSERVIRLRTGVVLDSADGALAKMLPPFKLGLGGSFGSGKQWMSWIALEDWIGAAYQLMLEGESGAYNLVSPNPLRNRTFGMSLASVLGRPSVLNIPSPVLNMIVGEFSKEGLLSSCRAEPAGLRDMGYMFRYPNVEYAIKFALGRK